ncbi:MAG TPA: tyrosine-type recombinase/integrase [Planctomycetaceae bacterium]|jgi:integrase|nr:tyrosine-type recombinase/integrase [Planctomycetaceae bacterium]
MQEGSYQRRGPEVSLANAKDAYLAFLTTEGRAKGTRTRYTGELRTLVEFCAGQRVTRLSKVTPAIMDAYRAERRKVCQLPTINHESMVIKQFLRWCQSRALITVNPLASYRVAKVIPRKRPAPTLEEVQAALANSPAWLRRILTTLAFAGIRIGELRHLLVEDVDLKENWIHVESREGAETKTKRPRKIPIHPVLRQMLVEHSSGGPWFFTAAPSTDYPEGGHWISPKGINEEFQKVAEGLGLPVGLKDNGYTVHSLRHFFETFSINSRIPQRVVDTWMGHQGDRSMGRVYYELTDDESQKFMQEVPFSLGTDARDPGRRNQTQE